MKNNILKIINELIAEEYFNDCGVELTINYKDIIKPKIVNNKITHLTLKNDHNILIDVIDRFTDEIEGYNLTLIKERGISDYGQYENDWKSVNIIFWSDDDQSDNKDRMKYGRFEWCFLSDMENYNPNGIRNYLSKFTLDKDGEPTNRIYGNYFKYDNMSLLVNELIKLDLLMDKQYKEKCEIYDKIKLFMN